jgi:hypothetical protein
MDRRFFEHYICQYHASISLAPSVLNLHLSCCFAAIYASPRQESRQGSCWDVSPDIPRQPCYAWLTLLRNVFPSENCYDSPEWWQAWHSFLGDDASFTSSVNQLSSPDYSISSPIPSLQPYHPNSTDLSANERCDEMAAYGTGLSSETGPDSRYVFPAY